MNRWFLAIAVLLGPVVGIVWSDYVVIMVDLTRLEESQAKKDKNGQDTGTPLFPGTLNQGVNLGAMGGMMGMPGGARGAMGGGMRGSPGGARGALGGAMGFPGGATGMPGQLGNIGGPGFPGAPRQPEEESTAGHLWAVVYLELKHPAGLFLSGKYYQIDTKLGKAYVPRELVKWQDANTPSVAKRFGIRKRNYYKGDKLPPPTDILIVADFALSHGLIPEFVNTMEDLLKVEAKNPAAVAFAKVRKDMQRPLSQTDPAMAIVQGFEGYRTEMSPHYALLTTAEPAVAKRYQDELEKTYEAFFYWFALKGKVLDVPNRRLVAVLERDKNDFDAKHTVFGSVPLVADGFVARRDNLAILSAQRTDEAYLTLDMINKTQLQPLKVALDELLNDKVYKRKELHNQGLNLYGHQTLALVQKAMQEESLLATTSHEGIRQLLAATGLIPRTVGAPEWVRFGLASFLETPHKAFYPGTGGPSWAYLKPFQRLAKEKDREHNDEMLLRVVSGHYFRQAYTTLRQANNTKADGDEKDSKDGQRERADKEVERARSTSWALTFYLNQRRTTREQLENYLQELASLPRDQEFSEQVLIACFARAFGLLDPSDPNKLNASKLERLANDWVNVLNGTTLDVDAKVEIPKDDPEKKKPKSGTFPGGFRPPGGGGPGGGAWLQPRHSDLIESPSYALRQERLDIRATC